MPRSSDSPSFNSKKDDEAMYGRPSLEPLVTRDGWGNNSSLPDLFHDELHRGMPGDALYEYDEDWLEEVDAKLLSVPVEAFEETCKSSMTQASRPLSTDVGSKPVPDMPVDDDDSIGVGYVFIGYHT